MPLASMTGFARADGLAGDRAAAWTWELRSVNGKAFDLRMRVPTGLDGLEPQLRTLAQARLSRGTVHATLAVKRPAAPVEARVNEDVLAAVVAAARALAGRIDARPPSLDGLLQMRGVVDIVERPESDEDQRALEAALLDGFGRALDDLAAARAAEGAAIGRVILGQVEEIARLVGEADACPARRPEAIRARLADQVKLLMDTGSAFDAERLHQEAVLLAAKADVREELDRLAAHVAQARALLAQGGPVGRKLDFLAQEFGREANTLCAKANDATLTTIGLSLKHVVDQFREQVQNLE